MTMDLVKTQPSGDRHVVAMPWPGRGHINPMMNLCKRLVRQDPNLVITFVVTEEWLGLIGSDPKPDSIRFATLPNLIPSELVRANEYFSFVDAVFTRLEEPFELLLDGLSLPPPSAIIADTYVIWAARVSTRRNIPLVSLWIITATMLPLVLHFDLLAAHGHFPIDLSDSEDDEIVDYIPGLPPMRLCDLPQIFNVKGQKMYKSFKPCVDELSKAKYLLFSSAYELEPKAVEFLTSKFDFPVYAVGPLIPFQDLSAGHDGNEPDYIQWLNKQPESSVLYISQGSFHSASEAQLEEIVRGVRESGVRFLWVARGSERKLKKAFEGSPGIAVSWCDQLRVLSHVAVGGFMTHCGFNSTLEGLYTGTPMLVFPFNWDQILNAKMVVEEWKVGMKIKEKKRDLLVKKEEVKELVKKFMDRQSEEGKEMRRRACDLGETCRRAVEENGSSYLNIDAFIKDLAKIE